MTIIAICVEARYVSDAHQDGSYRRVSAYLTALLTNTKNHSLNILIIGILIMGFVLGNRRYVRYILQLRWMVVVHNVVMYFLRLFWSTTRNL